MQDYSAGGKTLERFWLMTLNALQAQSKSMPPDASYTRRVQRSSFNSPNVVFVVTESKEPPG